VVWSVAGNIILAVAPCNIYVSGFKMQTSGNGNGFYIACASAQVGVGKINFGSMPGGSHIVCDVGAKLILYQPYTISGGASYPMRCDNLSEIGSGPITITLTGTPAFPGRFIESSMGLLNLYQPNWVGAVTGLKFYCVLNAVLNTYGNPTGIPGSVAGAYGQGAQVA
jgi:hypothetical protein